MKLLNILYIAIVIIFFTSISIMAQEKRLDSLSVKTKDKFFARLNSYVEYEIKQDWKSMFSLTTDSIASEKVPFLSDKVLLEDEFVKNKSEFQNKSKLVKFRFIGVTQTNGSENAFQWLITGCGRYKGKGNRYKNVLTGISATFYKDNWYFDHVFFLLKGVGEGLEIKCKLPKK